MTDFGWEIMEPSRNVLSDRLAAFLRTRYEDENRAKMLARDIDVEPRTALNYFKGYWPGTRQWRVIVRRFGDDVINAVFGPEIDAERAALEREVTELEAKLVARKARLQGLAGRQAGVARTEDGP